MSTYAIADLDGVLCIAVTVNHDNKPVQRTLYYPTVVRTRALLCVFQNHGATLEAIASKMTLRQTTPGQYEARSYMRLTFDLKDGGKTIPVPHSMKEETIPCPKTKLKTKYYYGAWWKQTAKKWVKA